METPTHSDSPILSPRSAQRERKKMKIFGLFGIKKKDSNDSVSSSSPSSSPASPRKQLTRIKDFGLYYPEKDEWLDPIKEVSEYCFPDGTELEYKRRVRDFKLRMQYEIKLFFPHYGWSKTITISPSTTTFLHLREKIIQWLHEENLFQEIPEIQKDEKLSQFGLYINNSNIVIEDENKLLNTYNIKKNDIINIKQIPGYTLEILSSAIHSKPFLMYANIDATFEYLIGEVLSHENIDKDKLIKQQADNENNNNSQTPSLKISSENLPNLEKTYSSYSIYNSFVEIKLPPPLGNLENFKIGFSRAILKTGDKFSISCSVKSWNVIIKRVPKDSQINTETRIPTHIILEGEKILSVIEQNVTIFHHVKGQQKIVKHSGQLTITNYRILSERKFQGGKEQNDWLEIPLTSIRSIEKQKSKDKNLRKHSLDIYCKSVRKITIGCIDNEQRNYVFRVISDTISKHSKSDLFAFFYKNEFGIESNSIRFGWDIYDPKTEFARMGIFLFGEDKFGWRFTNLNQNYEICKSYPSVLVVPASVNDETIKIASSFRTKSRIPSLVWIHPVTGVCLCR